MLSQALTAERRQAWAKLESRDHSTDTIFCHDTAGTSLMVLGSNKVTMRNGIVFSQRCAQHFKLRREDHRYQISHFSSYIVSQRTFSLGLSRLQTFFS